MDRSDFRRLAAVALLTLTGVLGCTTSRPSPLPASNPPAPKTIETDQDVVERVVEAHNIERAKRKLLPLTLDPKLEAAAKGQARDMAERRKMSHKGGDGSSPFDRIQRAGYRFRSAGENVAYGFDDVGEVMSGWMHSTGHRRNILGNYTEIGVGRAIAKDGASYWCVTFGTPEPR